MNALSPLALFFISLLISTLLGLVGYLLHRRNIDLEKQIGVLFQKNEILGNRIGALEFLVAKHYYDKTEINDLFKANREHMDARFDELKEAIVNK